ncbi:uncharacterized protein LOC100897234 [Galendromus occidentalis]|uniref:Uncharacterized protein LOC100897234 n=1 Tax=Galendromus occidentalis TaxID=34638 RepID=A0AAJ6VVK0_9ACAR|nr:uncharacterized protein LOC100897234 [Galendromus occidentalis]
MSAYASIRRCSLLVALIAVAWVVVAVRADEPLYPEGLLDRRFEKQANLVNILTRMLENQQGRYLYQDPLYVGGKRSGGLAPGFVGARGKKAGGAPGFVGARGKRFWVSEEERRR